MILDASQKRLSELLDLTGRIAVVTGGAKGLGRGIADRLAQAGARVMLGDIDAEEAAAAAQSLSEARGAQVSSGLLDVSDHKSVERFAQLTRDRFDRLDIWVNNAGIFPFAPALAVTGAMLDDIMGINVRGVFNCAQAAATHMIEQASGGVIVNIVSVSGFVARPPGVLAYGASKHAVRGLTRQLAVELAPHDIRVLGVAPSFVRTEGTTAALPAETRDKLTSRLGRVGVPDDIARVVLFCASDMASFMTGTTLIVDAGEIA